MSNPLFELRKLLNPTHVELIGTITSSSHPEYRVQVDGGSGPVLCTSGTVYNIGQRVFISNQQILRPAPSGQHSQIEV
ncbi:hypothetical protein [Acinetobacter sp.]|uniref:hypothetical protein n=1 Tax=Acinetobacter sp. TaxID=472 RepID=UPI0028B0B77E|nr:hypothetical protein [Acinetobacter sp.]